MTIPRPGRGTTLPVAPSSPRRAGLHRRAARQPGARRWQHTTATCPCLAATSHCACHISPYLAISRHISPRREHARFVNDASTGEWSVEDLGGQNGTWLNGRRLRRRRAVLAHGDELCFGCGRGSVISEVQYTFEREPPPSQQPPQPPQPPPPQPQPQPQPQPPQPSGQKRRAGSDAAGGAAAKRLACERELSRGAAEAAEEGAEEEAVGEEVEEVVMVALEEEAADETVMELGAEETATELGMGVRAEAEAVMGGSSGSPGGGPPRRLRLLQGHVHGGARSEGGEGSGGEGSSGSETEGEEEEVMEGEGEEVQEDISAAGDKPGETQRIPALTPAPTPAAPPAATAVSMPPALSAAMPASLRHAMPPMPPATPAAMPPAEPGTHPESHPPWGTVDDLQLSQFGWDDF